MFIVMLFVAVLIAAVAYFGKPAWSAYLMLAVLLLWPPTFAPILGLPYGMPAARQLHLLILFASCGGLVATRRGGCVRGRGKIAPVVVVIVAGLVSATANGNFAHAVGGLIPMAAVAAVASYLVALARSFPTQFRGVLIAVSVAAAGEAVVAIGQFFMGGWGIYESSALTASRSMWFDGRAAGTLGHPTVLGGFIAISACITTTLRHRWWTVTAVFDVAGLAVSGARAAWLAVACGILVGWVMTSSVRRLPSLWELVGAHLVAGLAPFVALSAGLLEGISKVWDTIASFVELRISSGANDVSFAAHQYRVDMAWNLINRSWLSWITGGGPGYGTNYLAATAIGDDQAVTFDNTYLAWWIDYGVLMLLVAVTMIAIACKSGRRHFGPLVTASIVVAGFDMTYWALMLVIVALTVAVAAGSVQGGGSPERVEGNHVAMQGVGL